MINRLLLLAFALFVSCGTSQHVGSRYLKTVAMTAAQGGTLSVTSAESVELGGLRLVVPSGALAVDTTLTLELGLDDVASAPNSPAGSVAVLGPALTFLKDVELHLPTAASYPGTGEVELLLVNASGVQRTRAPQLSYDAALHLISAMLRTTGSVQASFVACAAPCDGGLCDQGRCAAETCSDSLCGPALGSATCICSDGSVGCNTRRCLKGASGTCGWEFRTCP